MDNNQWKQEGLTKQEYEMIKERLGREPNKTELGMYGVMWSEHCSYKNSTPVLKQLPTEGEVVLQGPGENAGIIDIGDGQAVSFKVESHNHPSAIEPYEGAATGVGGIIRDIFTMGARPIACLNSLRFGQLENDRVQFLFEGVVDGISGYGNCIGVPTVGGEVYFSQAYQENPLVNVMGVGLMEQEDIATGTAKGVGNPVMIVGASTGRDGIQGASFASDELDEDSEEDRPAVQVGDPFREKLLLEACLELIKTDALIGIQDMGAAGITSSSCEMASRGGTGMKLDLDRVPQREEGMTPYEIMLSESQERMLVVPKKGKEEVVEEIFAKWDLHAAVIGEVTADGLLTIEKDKEVVANIPADSLAEDAPVYNRESKRPDYLDKVQNFSFEEVDKPSDYGTALLDVLSAPNVASKRWVYEQYDHMVQTNTVVLPGSDAAVLRVKGKNKALALTTDCNGRYCYLDPATGGQIAVAEAARNVVCSGAQPLAITDGMNFGNPLNPEIFWQFEQCVEGISAASQALDTPVTGGNVSFYNESPNSAVYPTPVIGMVGLIEDLAYVTTSEFKNRGDLIFLLGETEAELGGSEYLNTVHGQEKGTPPQINLDREAKVQSACQQAIRTGIINSAHDCSDGGLATTLAESCIQGELGAKIKVNTELAPTEFLFSETQSRIVVTVAAEDKPKLISIAKNLGVPVTELGQVTGEKLTINNLVDLPVKELSQAWESSIPNQMEG